MNENTNLIQLKGVGEKSIKLLNKCNLYTVGDLIHYVPKTYEQNNPLCGIKEGLIGEKIACYATVTASPIMKKIRNLTIIEVALKDSTGTLKATFFNMPYLRNILKTGTRHVFRGVLQNNKGYLVMEQPTIFTLEKYKEIQGKLLPVYPLTAGLTNQFMLKIMKQVCPVMQFVKERLPDKIIQTYDLDSYGQALFNLHFPSTMEYFIKSRRTLVFHEFFYFILAIRNKKEISNQLKNEFPMIDVAQTNRFMEALPYQLTSAQKNVWNECKEDLTGAITMNRLIQGDVGSGKTIIAFLALLMTVCNGYQGALMAPTEVLALQHFEQLKCMATDYDLPFQPVLLTGSTSAKEKRECYELIEQGNVNIIIGTHAIFQEKVTYHNLGLVITDEQHRFGVHQREMLAGKGNHPHVLVMSATPIPRTLAIILYGDMHLSVINELPSNRLPIKNCVINKDYRLKAYEFMLQEIQKGRQIYVICPLVEQQKEADGNEYLEDVHTYYEKLCSQMPQHIQIAILHGKMKPKEKNKIMELFSNGTIDILISTTVIEVGINVPNATVMMVEDAQRFGLASLHQLRGRVGRGKEQSYCIFINGSKSKQSKERLEILVNSNDGFHIANEDLKLRGPGDLFGIRQSGLLNFDIADIYQDADILKITSQCIDELLERDPHLELEEHKAIREQMNSENCLKIDFRTI